MSTEEKGLQYGASLSNSESCVLKTEGDTISGLIVSFFFS